MNKGVLLTILIVAFFLSMLYPCHADMEWTLKKEFEVEAAPRDMALSPDGQWMIALVKGEVLIYSTIDDKIIKRIPVDDAFDTMSFSAADNTILVANSSGKAIRLIHLEKVHNFSLAGLPPRGREDAPVTIAIFSDYQ
ncbi:MAG: hypothetical protein C4581_00565 [Nitrospiraceae bacterium]|nr:MAG: hypothetical protein C4581_00565 [Nitrospiraceae bacterium]